MSQYTTEVRYICETYAGLTESTEYSDVENVLAKSIGKVFDFTFPIFDENYRSVLETKILRHYYTREIGMETVGLWKLKLNTKMNEIMPYYNQLYKSELYEFNPFYDVDLTTSGNKKGNENSENEKKSTLTSGTTGEIHIDGNTVSDVTGSSVGNQKSSDSQSKTGTDVDTISSTEKYSDTPQGALTDLMNDKYLTNATVKNTTDSKTINEKTDGSGTNESEVNTKEESDVTENRTTESSEKYDSDSSENSTGKMSSTEEYLETVKGKNGGKSYSSLLMEYRKTFLNIDMMVIEELSDLFMQLW